MHVFRAGAGAGGHAWWVAWSLTHGSRGVTIDGSCWKQGNTKWQFPEKIPIPMPAIITNKISSVIIKASYSLEPTLERLGLFFSNLNVQP